MPLILEIAYTNYTITEETPEGYTSTLTQEGNVFTIIYAADVPIETPVDTPEQEVEDKEEAPADGGSVDKEEQPEEQPAYNRSCSDEDVLSDGGEDVPKTDDISGFMFWFAVCFVSAIGVAVTARKSDEIK